MKNVYLLGCSFTYQINEFSINIENKLKFPASIINLAFPSKSNFQILEDVKKLPKDSIAIIQWSALTRPNGMIGYEKDWNKDLNEMLKHQSDPLRFLIENFITVVNEANIILKKMNVKHYQYIGWQQWADSEIDSDLNYKLNQLNINWFKTPKLKDIISTNCWHYNPNSYVQRVLNFFKTENYWEWDSTSWGGLSEWVRLNVIDENLRYKGYYNTNFDSHPSEFATTLFYDQIIIPNINLLLTDAYVQNNK
jgi:hypothetical protein